MSLRNNLLREWMSLAQVATRSKDKVGPRLSTVGRATPGAAQLVNQERRRPNTDTGGVCGDSRRDNESLLDLSPSNRGSGTV